MMRIAWVIVLMGVIAAGVVKLRSDQHAAQAAMYRIEAERLKVRRKLWNQQLELGRLMAPGPTLWRAQTWPLEIVGPDGSVPVAEEVAENRP